MTCWNGVAAMAPIIALRAAVAGLASGTDKAAAGEATRSRHRRRGLGHGTGGGDSVTAPAAGTRSRHLRRGVEDIVLLAVVTDLDALGTAQVNLVLPGPRASLVDQFHQPPGRFNHGGIRIGPGFG